MTLGVCLAQLGTPDSPTVPAVRRYLREFLTDRRVIQLSPLLWKPILHGIILRTRPKRSAALYQRIWTDEGSPLLVHTRGQARKLAAKLGEEARVSFGMRIGNPGLARALTDLAEGGCTRILVLPLFPQYSRTTTASVEDLVGAWLKERADAPETKILGSFPDHAAFITALAGSVRDAGFTPSAASPLVMSFHGIPQRYADKGDPYPQECERTGRALAAELALEPNAWRMTFQSRFGPSSWIRPYTDRTLRALAAEGIGEVGVISPSFASDCLETIDEIGRELRDEFLGAGGKTFTRVDCLNDSDAFVDALASIVRESA